MHEVCNKLTHVPLPALDREVRPYFQDVLDHVRRVETRVGGLREILTSVFEAANLLEQQRQGVITRQLAAWAAIFAVPTAIAGIYGMNFANMPELKTDYGYFIVLGVIALLCSGLLARHRDIGEIVCDIDPSGSRPANDNEPLALPRHFDLRHSLCCLVHRAR